MLRRLGQFLLVLACALSLGAHWATLQTVAWTGMFVERALSEPVGDALAKTFDGQHPCALCLAVRQGRAAEQASETPGSPSKPFDLALLMPEAVLVLLPDPADQTYPLSVLHPSLPNPPSVPPPRSA